MALMAAGIVGGAALLSGMMASDAASSAASKQAGAARYAADIQAEQRKPWVEAGTQALQRLQTGLAPGGEYAKPFTMADAQNMPAYQFALQQGTGAIEGSAAARGGLLSTGTLQDLTKFAEGTASQYENQAFNQWLAQQQMQLGAQQSLAQVGQTQVGQVADAYSNAALAAGGAGAGATVAQANILGGTLTGLGKTYADYSMYNKLFQTPTSPIPMSGATGIGEGMGVNISPDVMATAGY